MQGGLVLSAPRLLLLAVGPKVRRRYKQIKCHQSGLEREFAIFDSFFAQEHGTNVTPELATGSEECFA